MVIQYDEQQQQPPPRILSCLDLTSRASKATLARPSDLSCQGQPSVLVAVDGPEVENRRSPLAAAFICHHGSV